MEGIDDVTLSTIPSLPLAESLRTCKGSSHWGLRSCSTLSRSALANHWWLATII